MNTNNDYTITSVLRALKILKLFDNTNSEMSLTEISSKIGLGKSTTLRLLFTLNTEGFIYYDEESKKYSLGLALYELGNYQFNSMDFRKIALPYLRKIADETSLICYLAVESENVIVMLEKVFPKSVPVWAQLMVPSGGTLPLYSAGIGRLFLAQRSDEEIRRYLNNTEIKKITEETILDKERIFGLVLEARENGYSGNFGENEPFISSICAPIFDHSGGMIAGISMGGVKEAVYGEKREENMRQLLEAAKNISAKLGYKS